MTDFSKIDQNFKVETKINKPDVVFYDTKQEPFVIYGVFFEGDRYRRMPESVAKAVSNGVYQLHANTAGGRVRFRTDSPYVAIHAKMPRVSKMPHFPFSGSIGLDLYTYRDGEERFYEGIIPPFDVTDGYEGVVNFENREMREVTINFPLYSDLSDLYIGLAEGARLLPTARQYRDIPPVVYYGSSITQGGCASRPGNAYEAIVSRRLNVDHINLGFSGNAMGEETIARYIASLEMSAFVYDYDHNSPHAAYLEQTHEPMFRIIREAHPDLPILMLTRPKCRLLEEEKKRLAVIRATYRHAVEAGDKNVYLIEGTELMALCGDDGVIDRCHPSDLGFYSMARAVGDALEKILA